MDFQNILRFLKGKFTKKELQIYCASTFILSATLILISRILYPVQLNYSIFTHTLSYLGDYFRNPKGWIYFSFALFLMAISFATLISYIHRRVVLIFPGFARIGTIFLIIGSIGIFLVGLFPDAYGDDFIQDVSMGKVHNLISLFAIFGILLGLIIYGLLFLIDYYEIFRRNHKELYPKTITRPFFFLLAFAGFGTLITQIISGIRDYEWPGPGIFSFPLWEWILTVTFVINIYFLALIVSNEIPEVNGI